MAGRCNNCHTWSQWQVETQLRQTDFAAMLSDATARLKMAEPAELSHFEPSRAIKLAHNQNGLGSAHELAQPG